MTLAMLIFGLITVLAAAGVVFSRRTLSSALFLVTTFFLMSAHYALLGADFIAALQVMVYAGAIMVLVIFVIMLLGLREPLGTERLQLRHYIGVVFLGLFVAVLVFASSHPSVLPGVHLARGVLGGGPAIDVAVSPEEVGRALFTEFLFPFEVISVLLLAAVIGAVLLAYDPKRPLPVGRGLRAKRTDSDHDEDADAAPHVKRAA